MYRPTFTNPRGEYEPSEEEVNTISDLRKRAVYLCTGMYEDAQPPRLRYHHITQARRASEKLDISWINPSQELEQIAEKLISKDSKKVLDLHSFLLAMDLYLSTASPDTLIDYVPQVDDICNATAHGIHCRVANPEKLLLVI